MRARLAVLMGLVLLVAGVAPVGALHGKTGKDFEPNLRLERVWFTCGASTKAHLQTSGSVPWKLTAPTQSVQAGAGCGVVDNGLWGNNQVSVQDAHFAGTYAGNLNQITVEAHNIYVGEARASGPFTVNVRLNIDGTDIYGATGKDVQVMPVRSSTGASEMIKFTMTNLNMLTEPDDIEHNVIFTLSGGRQLANPGAGWPVREAQSIWVYDTTEVPSGLTFNPTAAEAVKLPR